MRFWPVLAVVLPLTLASEMLKAMPAESGSWRLAAIFLASLCAALITAYTATATNKADYRVPSKTYRRWRVVWLLGAPLLGVLVSILHHIASVLIGVGVVAPLAEAALRQDFDPATASLPQIVALSTLTLIPTTLLSIIVAIFLGRLIIAHAPNRGSVALLAGAGFPLLSFVAVAVMSSEDRAEFLLALNDTDFLLFALGSIPWAALFMVAFLAGAFSFGRQKAS